ncbi:MAG: DUF3488 domain-containing protein [Planctomycetales bacterium]|nr:DUF3488 domain-containing protein [Planctomycetales bacterium]
MAMTSVQKLRWTLTLHFAVIAWLTAMLVSTGSGSIFLPLFIFLVSCAALIFVDGLQWFEIGRIGSYIGMTVATIISISSYFYSAFSVPSESGQLMAIAGLLVYPEAVLFLQRKNLRIFEQLAVFLLLEMIVAALVNDNILFGILLAPIMLLWVSALFLFSRYATLVQIDPTLETPLPTLREILFRKFVKTVLGEAPKVQVVSPQLQLPEVHSSRTLRRTLQSIPIGLGAILFSGFFFYLLPRTATTSLDPSIGYETNVGLPKSLTIGTVGRLLLDRTPVMRVSLTHSLTGQAYPLQQPPYLRARVMDSYGSSNRGRLATQREWVFGGIQDYQTLKGIDNRDRLSAPNRDAVRVEFEIKRQFAGAMFTIPPVFSNNKQQAVPLNYDNFNMLLEELDPTCPAARRLFTNSNRWPLRRAINCGSCRPWEAAMPFPRIAIYTYCTEISATSLPSMTFACRHCSSRKPKRIMHLPSPASMNGCCSHRPFRIRSTCCPPAIPIWIPSRILCSTSDAGIANTSPPPC